MIFNRSNKRCLINSCNWDVYWSINWLPYEQAGNGGRKGFINPQLGLMRSNLCVNRIFLWPIILSKFLFRDTISHLALFSLPSIKNNVDRAKSSIS